MTYQAKTYHETDWSKKAEQVRACIEQNPGKSIAQLADLLGWHKSSVSGRVNDLKKFGCITTTKGTDSADIYAYDPDPARWAARAKQHELTTDLARIEKFVKRYGAQMTPNGKKELRKLYLKIRGQN